MADPLTQELLNVARQCADAAAAITLDYFRSDRLGIENKEPADFDPVTHADRQAEKAIRAVLSTKRANDSILGEEFGAFDGTSGLKWILDPIDGTRGFISGTPTWGTLISVDSENGPKLGLVDQPYIGERFIGTNAGAFLERGGQSKVLNVSRTKELKDATILTTFPEIGTQAERGAFHALAGRTKLTRYGMDCYGYALLAAGQVDLVVEAGLAVYDIHAPATLVQAAGGVVTDWDGGSVMQGGRAIAASTPELHAAALEFLRNVG